MEPREWLLKRNCSLTPRQTLLAFLILCALSFGVGLAFRLLHGTWIVFCFAAAEMTIVALAFIQYARHATDRERIVLADDSLTIEQLNAGVAHRTRLDSCWLRITPPRHDGDMIALEARGVRIEIGRFATEQKRREIANELRHGLRGHSLI